MAGQINTANIADINTSDEAIACPSCGSRVFIRHGLVRGQKQRWRCTACGRTSIHFYPDRFRRSGIRIEAAKVVNLLVSMGRGLSIRAASRLAGVNHRTGISIVRVSGFVRQCRKCAKPISGNRFMYCSDQCQEWRSRSYLPTTGSRELFDGTANVLRCIESAGCSPHVRLAIEVATEFSERNMDLYLGPVYCGIEEGHAAGIVDARVLRRMARDTVKQHWKEIQTFGARSLDAMKEHSGYEAIDDDGEFN